MFANSHLCWDNINSKKIPLHIKKVFYLHINLQIMRFAYYKYYSTQILYSDTINIIFGCRKLKVHDRLECFLCTYEYIMCKIVCVYICVCARILNTFPKFLKLIYFTFKIIIYQSIRFVIPKVFLFTKIYAFSFYSPFYFNK